MAQQIAELFAKIGADTTGLKKGLQDTKAGLEQTGQQATTLQKALNMAGAVASWALVGQAVRSVGRYIEDSINDVTQYNKSISDLSRNIGASLQDTSRLAQVADDYQISQQQLTTAMQLAVKNGFEPSIANLAQLADQYVSIKDPVERAAILTEKFGRNWAVLTPLLSKGGAALREQAAAVNSGLVVTEASLKASEDYRLAVDNLSDSWRAFSMTVGNSVIPTLTQLIDLMNQASKMEGDPMAAMAGKGRRAGGYAYNAAWYEIQAQKRSALEGRKDADMGYTYAPTAAPVSDTNAKRYSLTLKQAKELNQLSFAEQRNAFMVEQTERKMDSLNTFMAGPVGKENKTYLNAQRDIQRQLAETAARIEELRKTPWKKEEIEEAQQQYAGLQQQVTDNADAHKLASKQIIFDLAAQMMAQNGLTSAEADAQVQLAEKFGLIDKETAQLWESIKDPVDEMSNGKTTAEEWVKVMERLANRWDVTVAWHYENAPEPGSGNGAWTGGSEGAAQEFAEGGTYQAGVPRLVGERGPELDIPASSGRVVNNDDLRQMLGAGGGGSKVVQNITVSLALPRENYSAMQLVRELQRYGGVQ